MPRKTPAEHRKDEPHKRVYAAPEDSHDLEGAFREGIYVGFLQK